MIRYAFHRTVQVKRAFEIRRENGRAWLRTRSGRLLAVDAP